MIFCGLKISAESPDSIGYLPKETQVLEAIEFDQKKYESFKSNKAYDYYQVKPEGTSFWDLLLDRFFSWLKKNVNPNITRKQVNVSVWIIAGIIFAFLAFLLYKYRPSLFYVDKKRKHSFEVEDENIHELSFDELIAKSIADKNYEDAIRWRYLQVLKALHEKELISWDANKTVNEYVYELKQSELKPEFRQLSQQFIYYRYGNGEATDVIFNQFSSLGEEIIKRI